MINKQGWEIKKLGEVCDFQGGNQPPKSEWSTKPKEGYIRMLQIRDFTQQREIKEYVKNNKNLKICKADEILIGRYGASVGKILTGLSGAYNVAIIKSIPDEDIISRTYIKYYFESQYFQTHLLEKCSSRAAQAGFNKDDINNCLIKTPNLQAQNKIVKELDTLQAIITKKKAQLEELDKLAQATFYDMFGDPVENEKGWEFKKLKLFGDILTGNTPSRKKSLYYENSYIEWIKTDNITNNLIISKAREHLSKEGYKVGRLVKKGALLVTCIAGSLNSIGRSALTDRNVCFNQQINAIQPYDNVNSIFLYWLFKVSACYIQQNTPGVLKFILSKTNFEKLTFILPPLPLQNQFAKRIEAIEKQKALINQSIAETQLLFDSAMDNYFN